MLTLLVIESDPLYATQIQKTIESLQNQQLYAEVLHAPSLEEARLFLRATPIDLILTNLFLRDAIGPEIILQLQAEELSIPILLCGSQINDSLADSAIQAGAQDFFDIERGDPLLLTRLIRFALERNHLIESLRALSFTDEMTLLYNRRGFFILTEEQLQRSKNGSTLFIMDLDHLKEINDHHGHPVGDHLLREVAPFLRSHFRRFDIIGRLGGDEFAVLALNTPSSFGEQMREKLKISLKEHNQNETRPFSFDLGIGFSYYDPLTPLSMEELFIQADQLLHEDKSLKKGIKATRTM